MATDIQVGTATIFGCSNGATISVTGYATFLMQGAKPSHKFDLKEIKDANGFDACLIATNGRIEMTMDFVPSASSKSSAAALATFLSPLTAITTAGFTISVLNGRWVYTGDEAIDVSNTDSAKISLPVRKYDDSTQNTSLTTTVS